jgi:general secretion pathway protein M
MMDALRSPTRGTATEAFGKQLEPLRKWWAALPLRERQLIAVAAVVLGLFMLWTLAVVPAWRTVRTAPAQIDALDVQLQSMQRLAAEAVELRAAPSIPTAQAAAALQSASGRLGERARLSLQGDRAVLTLEGIESEALRSWLAEARSGARARPIDVQLARGPQGFTGTLTVTLGGAP